MWETLGAKSDSFNPNISEAKCFSCKCEAKKVSQTGTKEAVEPTNLADAIGLPHLWHG